MPGYSGTPLPKKLGIKEKFRVAFVELPTDVRAELRQHLVRFRGGTLELLALEGADGGDVAFDDEFAQSHDGPPG